MRCDRSSSDSGRLRWGLTAPFAHGGVRPSRWRRAILNDPGGRMNQKHTESEERASSAFQGADLSTRMGSVAAFYNVGAVVDIGLERFEVLGSRSEEFDPHAGYIVARVGADGLLHPGNSADRLQGLAGR